MLTLRKSEDRGHARHGWLDSRHSFSFADYHDPAHAHFRALRVINEDRVAPGKGFGLHPHRDMEIITYVIEGELRHSDSIGHTSTLRAGEIQRISAGAGILHSETNASTREAVHFLQIWITPDHRGAKPAYGEKSLAHAAAGKLHLIASKTGRDGSLAINQETDLLLGHLEKGQELQYPLSRNRHARVQMLSGEATVNAQLLRGGDGAALSAETSLSFAGILSAKFLLFDLN